MKRAITLLFLFLAGCDRMMHGDAIDAVKAELSDPDSAEFKDWFSCPSGKGWTGQVNAKGPMGGYTGYEGFVVVGYHAAVGPTEDFPTLMNECLKGAQLTSAPMDKAAEDLNSAANDAINAVQKSLH